MKNAKIMDNRRSCLYFKEIKFCKSQIYKHKINSTTKNSTLDTVNAGAKQMKADGFKMIESQLEI